MEGNSIKVSVAFRSKRCYSNKRCQQNNGNQTKKLLKKLLTTNQQDVILAESLLESSEP